MGATVVVVLEVVVVVSATVVVVVDGANIVVAPSCGEQLAVTTKITANIIPLNLIISYFKYICVSFENFSFYTF